MDNCVVERYLLLIPVAIGVAIAVRVAAWALDRKRIARAIEERGGQVLETGWLPLDPPWFGRRVERTYRVRYLDEDGNEHECRLTTNGWIGVCFSDDRIVNRSSTR